MPESKFERIQDPADPRRCQAISAGKYQCIYVAVEGTKFCPRHSASTASREAESRQQDWNYNLTKFRARVQAFAEHPKVKSLREEVGVLRMLLESLINKCKDETELLIYSSKITDLVMKVDKVVASCHTLEAKTGQVLDRSTVINIAEAIVQIIGNYVDDSDILASISGDITMLLKANLTEQDANAG